MCVVLVLLKHWLRKKKEFLPFKSILNLFFSFREYFECLEVILGKQNIADMSIEV